MSYFIEDADLPFTLQIENFAQKLPAYATQLGFTPAEVAEAAADSDFWGSILTADNQVEKYAHDYKHFKHLLRHGSKTEVITALEFLSLSGQKSYALSATFTTWKIEETGTEKSLS